MYQGEVEVAWCTTTKDGEAVLAVRMPEGCGFTAPRPGTKLVLTLAIPQPARRPGVRTKLAALAGRWCRDEVFQQWLAATFPEDQVQCSSNCPSLDATEADRAREIAAAVVRTVCEVESRTEFDSDAAAGERFGRLIRLPYRDWLISSRPVHVTEGNPA